MSASIRTLRSPVAYHAAQHQAARLLLANPGKDTLAGIRLEIPGILIEAYDHEHFPLGPQDPITAIEFAMDQRALKPKDLIPILGSRARVSEVLKGRRPLTLEQIRRLQHALHIPLECLLGESASPSASRSARNASARAGVRVRRSSRQRRATKPKP